MRLLASALLAAGLALTAMLAGRQQPDAPLWPGARHTREERERAVLAGLDFLYRFARNPDHFRDWGHDLLDAFCNIASTSRDAELRARAWKMGRERALEWRRRQASVPEGVSVDAIWDLVMGNSAAERLGVTDSRFYGQLRQAATRFSVVDYLGFDPAREPPPADIPKPCSRCGAHNRRGSLICSRCGAKLEMYDPYEVLQDALIDTYTADLAGIELGAHYDAVAQWLPVMLPFPARRPGDDREYYAAAYTATHIVYTSNRYSQFLLSPACFPDVFAYLKANFSQAIADRDAETVGEFLDSLRAFGLTVEDPLIRTGFDYLLSVQNPDGSWGDRNDRDPYGRYHPTWTAVDGLREYRWSRVIACTMPHRAPAIAYPTLKP